MTTLIKNLCLMLFLAIMALLFSNCVRQEFDAPPAATLPDLAANATIQDLLALHAIGSPAQLVEDVLIIEGIVVADDQYGNFYKNIVLQDETGGIAIRLNSTGLYNEYPIGRKVVVNTKGLYLSDYNGLPQLGGSPTDALEEVLIPNHIFVGESGQTIPTKTFTLERLSDLETARQHINTLITIENVQFAQEAVGKTYGDVANRWSVNLEIEDCEDNTIVLRSSGYADFAADLAPNANGTITAILGIYKTTPQLSIRNVSDIQFVNDRCTGDVVEDENEHENVDNTTTQLLSTDFSGLTNGASVEIAGWKNIAMKGERLWQAKEFSGNTYAQATAYSDSSEQMEAWLITPIIDVSKAKTFSFESAKAFYKHDGLSVWIATNFDGNNLESADWQPLTATIAGKEEDDHAWISSGTIDLSAFSGTAHIGFKYEGNNSTNTTSYRIDNVKVGE